MSTRTLAIIAVIGAIIVVALGVIVVRTDDAPKVPAVPASGAPSP